MEENTRKNIHEEAKKPMGLDKKCGKSYDFAVGSKIAKEWPWSLINDNDSFPIEGGVIRAYVLPYGLGFRIEKSLESFERYNEKTS
ncbi:MAG: hypothetical protein GY853_14195 [PVC group bacterium]|nr:hypothetical protein [PVC group bacterium]